MPSRYTKSCKADTKGFVRKETRGGEEEGGEEGKQVREREAQETDRPIVGVTLHVLLLDEGVDTLTEDVWCGHEARLELVDDLADEVVVLQVVARLHDTHDGGVDTSRKSRSQKKN